MQYIPKTDDKPSKSTTEKKERATVKTRLHPRNKHRERYDFEKLIASCPDLAPFVTPNKYGDDSVDFFNAEAVRVLNKALLKLHYDIDGWDIPKDYLCPPIPGRADYLHHIADLLSTNTTGSGEKKIPMGSTIRCLDVGVGASCVYPLIGIKEYGWSFVGSDIDPVSIESATKIMKANPTLKDAFELRLQKKQTDIFSGIIKNDERFDLTICNPPYHASFEEAQSGTARKLRNLKNKRAPEITKNFGGHSKELWCEGGERKFVRDMIFQSKKFATSCYWFSTLISKQTHLKNAYQALKELEAVAVKTIPMGQGNKTSRIVAWTFLTKDQQRKWISSRWNG